MAINFPRLEEEILEFWKKEKIFEKSLTKKSPKGDFVFFEGPPTANGKPGIHHVLTRAFKDIILRYKTMRGYRVPRKAGWDTHGLPVELEVEKKLGISGKKQIENIVSGNPRASIQEFNKLCKESVWTYKTDWEEMTNRVGFWVDLENPYITYDNHYIETLWTIINKIYNKKLLYEDYKIVPYCPRCGTTLSSHEVAQGYKDDTVDPSVYVKFKIQDSKFPSTADQPQTNKIQNSYFLVWTTTPWTLPGNIALAVGKNIIYIRIKVGDEEWILAKDRLSVIDVEYKILEEVVGKNLEGVAYAPLYRPFDKAHEINDYKVHLGNFVSTTDGTGIVHIAPAFGEEDHALGKEKNLSLLLTVDQEGKINVDVPGKGKFVKTADKDIADDLQTRGLLYKKETITHTYPFCWRCSAPLLYYAKLSWWIKMSALKDKLIKNNNQINWVPKHLKEGRFGEWLRGIKDWAFSRERYWGTPLPIWRCGKCGETKCVGSINDFSSLKNKYFLIRHGEADNNIKKVVTSSPEAPFHLTENGKKQISELAKKLKNRDIDLIFASDIRRTKETAEIVSRELNIKTVFDDRLHELNFGEYNNLSISEYHAKFANNLERFDKAAPNGETLSQVLARQVNLINELEKKYENKNVLFIGHGDPLWLLEAAYLGLSPKEMIRWADDGNFIQHGEIHELRNKNIPQNDQGFLDLHRPYIDEVVFQCKKCASPMKRVSDVCDVWFDSGAMPFAQDASLKNTTVRQRRIRLWRKILNPKSFPANYICEAIDQTRGWFYTLLAVSTLLDYKVPPYKNVISLGHVLDVKGQKMSKSKGNVVVPKEVLDKYGADATRLYFYTSGQPSEPKKFDIKGVDDTLKKTLLILWNIFEFWKLYAGEKPINYNLQPKTLNILDQWMLAKLNLLIKEVTEHLDQYEITEAGRELQGFITDLSTWYLRRSRDRFKVDGENKNMALATLGYALQTTVKLLAPFAPFISEKIYRGVVSRQSSVVNGASVHLADWPKVNKKMIDAKLLSSMKKVRQVVSLALEDRAKSGIAVRQPLLALTIKGTAIEDALLVLIKDEINVKNIFQETGAKELEIMLDKNLTSELRLEGLRRDLIRQINALRKEAGLTIHDKVRLQYETGDGQLEEVMQKFNEEIKIATLSLEIKFGRASTNFEKELEIAGEKIWLGLKK